MSRRFTGEATRSFLRGDETRVVRSLRAVILPVAAVAVVLGLLPIWLADSRLLMGLAVTGLVYACYAIAFNIIFGSTGQLFLSVGALAGIGGYGAALLGDKGGLPIVACVILATLASGLAGGILSWIAVHRSLDVIFTGIVTLIFGLAFENLLLGLGGVTGGESGLLIGTGGDSLLRERIPPYFIFLGLVVAFLVIHGLLQRSHVGWAFRALRDDEEAAGLAGVNVARYRIYGAVTGASMLGLAGGVYALSEGRISPTTFGFGEVDVVVIVMLAFGGISTLLGPVLGAGVFTIFDEVLIEFGQLRVVAYGALIIALFVWLPKGLLPTVRGLVQRARSPKRGAVSSGKD